MAFLLSAVMLQQLSTAASGHQLGGKTTSAQPGTVAEYSLPNGLQLLLAADPSSPTITVVMTYYAGSRLESVRQHGVAHLLEHVSFRCTANHPNPLAELAEHGGRFNANTSWDHTSYSETIPASESHLDWALGFEADRMRNACLRPGDVKSEQGVVTNELEFRDVFVATAIAETMKVAYADGAYGRPIGGSAKEVSGLTAQIVHEFYESQYQPGNAVLIVAGNFNPDVAVRLATKHFGTIGAGGSRALWPVTEVAQRGERSTTVEGWSRSAAVIAAYRIPDATHSDFAPLQVLAELSNTPRGPLQRTFVDSHRDADAFARILAQDQPGALLFGVTTTQRLDRVRKALLDVIGRLTLAVPSTPDTEAAKARLEKDLQDDLRDSEKLAQMLGTWAARGNWRLAFIHRDRIHGVTPADVHRVAVKYLMASNRTVGQVLPQTNSAHVVLRKDPPLVPAQREELPSETSVRRTPPGAISLAQAEAGVQRFQLASGLRVSLLPTGAVTDAVRVAMEFHFGTRDSLRNKRSVALMTGGMLMRGTRTSTGRQLQDRLRILGIQLQVVGGPTSVKCSLSTSRTQLIAAIQLLAEVLQTPSFSKQQLEQERASRIQLLESTRKEPLGSAVLHLSKLLSASGELGGITTITEVDESIASLRAVTRQDVVDFHRQFHGGSNGALAIVGNFEPLEVSAAVRSLFSEWRSRSEFSPVPSPPATRGLRETIAMSNRPVAVLAAGTALKCDDLRPDYPALVLAHYVVLGAGMTSRVSQRIRGDLGLSYGVASAIVPGPVGDCHVQILGLASPDTVDQVQNLLFDEIRRASSGGFTEDEVTRAAQAWIETQRLRQSTSRGLADLLVARHVQGRPLTWDVEMETRVSALTSADLQRALSTHLDPSQFDIVIARGTPK